MKICVQLWHNLAEFFLEWEIFLDKIRRQNLNTNFMFLEWEIFLDKIRRQNLNTNYMFLEWEIFLDKI